MAVAYSNNWRQLNSYRNQSVIGLTPAELLLKTYDLTLSALAARDRDRASRGIAALIDGLDFRYQEISNGLFRLYRYCMEETKEGNLETPTRLLRELRQIWAEAFDRLERSEKRVAGSR